MNEWGQQLPFETLPQMTMNNTIYCTCLLVSVPFRSLCTAVFVAVCPSHLGWQYKEVMPSSLSRLGSCEEINWFALRLNFISDSVDVASSRICSVHTTFPAVAARKFPWSGKLLFGTVRNSAMTRTYLPPSRHSIILKFWLEICGPSHQDRLLLCWCYQFCRNCTLCQRKLAMTL